ncbi:MAG: ATP-dependent protease, partial [Deltaproteobacteria bacterium]|nr:ATP-dependent protease [Deltaproteobacteria bacterium]
IQTKRFEKTKIYSNSQMTSRMIKKYCKTDDEASTLLETAIDRLGLSARAYNRVLKVARTIADLEGEKDVRTCHVSEAIQYRGLDRKRFA